MPPQTPAIEASGLGKRFELRHERPASLAQQVMAIVRREPRSEPFWALRDVSFEVPSGRALGVIGRNGSGKSTLLKILAGTLRPTTGRLTVRGSVSTLLQIGGGFHPDFSGRNNAFVSAALLGIPAGQLRDQFDELVAFAELDRFIDVPTKYYSSGMLARLGFAVSMAANAEITIIDEVLGVGDAAFQRKCEARLRTLMADGRTVVLVSHDANAVRSLCDEALWLDRGVVRARGAAADVVNAYESSY